MSVGNSFIVFFFYLITAHTPGDGESIHTAGKKKYDEPGWLFVGCAVTIAAVRYHRLVLYLKQWCVERVEAGRSNGIVIFIFILSIVCG